MTFFFLQNFIFKFLDIRKLIKKRENPKYEQKKRNIIEEYSNFESETYAPLTRVGYFPDKNADNYVVKNRYLDTYQGRLISI